MAVGNSNVSTTSALEAVTTAAFGGAFIPHPYLLFPVVGCFTYDYVEKFPLCLVLF